MQKPPAQTGKKRKKGRGLLPLFLFPLLEPQWNKLKRAPGALWAANRFRALFPLFLWERSLYFSPACRATKLQPLDNGQLLGAEGLAVAAAQAGLGRRGLMDQKDASFSPMDLGFPESTYSL